MDNLVITDAPDITLYGKYVDESKFIVTKVVDKGVRKCYLLRLAKYADSELGMDNIRLSQANVTIRDGEFLIVRASNHIDLPPIIKRPHPFISTDESYVRKVLTTMELLLQ